MAASKRTILLGDAVRQGLASLDVLPDTNEARLLRNECLSWEQVAKDWVLAPPTPEERERAMKKVIALHVAIARLRRESQRPPRLGEPE